MMNFGSVVTHLRICGYRWSEQAKNGILDSVANNCSNSLESLELVHFDIPDIPDNFAAKLRPLVNNLQKLTIEECKFNGASRKLLAHCESLAELEFNDGYSEFILENTFPKLQKFVYKPDDHDDFLPVIWNSFIVRHPILKSLETRNHIKPPSLQSIADNCTELRELEFSIGPDDKTTFDLSNFGHLRKLEIYCSDRDVMKTVQGWNNLNIESLSLEFAEIDSQFIRTLSQLKCLQVLELAGCTGLQNLTETGLRLTKLKMCSYDEANPGLDLVLLIKRLRNLKDLSVHGIRIDLETYLGIVEQVQLRPDKSKLTFKLFDLHRSACDDMRKFARNAHTVEMLEWD